MKTTIRHVLSCAVFLAIGAGLLLAAGVLLSPKVNHTAYGVEYPNAEAVRAEAPETLDILFVGNSESFYAFDPMVIWQETGIASYVCGTGGQSLYTTEEYIDGAFRTQSPKYVVVEPAVFYHRYEVDEEVDNRLERLFPVLRYHHRWRSLTEEDWTQLPDYTETDPLKGLHKIRFAAVPADTEGFMAPGEQTFLPQPIAIRKIREIYRRCRRAGAELIFVSAPSTVNWSTDCHNGVAALAEELGVTYLDLNRMPEEVPIDWNTDSWDGGDHLNYRGSEKVSRYLAGYFADKGLPDHRGEAAYAQWDRDLAEYLRQLHQDPAPAGGE